MYKLNTIERAQILTALAEGNSIASTCRMFGCNKITVLRLLADAGTLAAQYHDLTVCNLKTRRIQCDELWGFVGSKQKNVPAELQGVFGIGDVWTWTAIDADSKLIIGYKLGLRNGWYAHEFMKDIAARLAVRVQLTTDGLRAYLDAVDSAFGNDIDYAQLIKIYGNDRTSSGKYSPPEVIGIEKEMVCGAPQPRHISTSYVERSNLTVRMGNRRFTRLTNAFSKKLANHEYMCALTFFHYNFIRVHQTLKTTPAVKAGLTDREWTMVDFVKMLEREEGLLGGRLTSYKPSKKKAG